MRSGFLRGMGRTPLFDQTQTGFIFVLFVGFFTFILEYPAGAWVPKTFQHSVRVKDQF